MLAASILSPQFIAGVIIVIVILCIIGSCIRIVPQAHAVIVERLGGYLTTWSVGVHIKMPFVDHVARNVILKEQVVDFDPQPVITKDNVTMLEFYNGMHIHQRHLYETILNFQDAAFFHLHQFE